MILFLSHSLWIVTRTDHDLTSTLRNPSFVDPILSLIKIPFWYQHNTITIHSLDSHSSLVRAGTLLFLFSLCCISSLWQKSLLHNWFFQVIQDYLGWPLCLGKLCLQEPPTRDFKAKVLSLQDSLHCSTHKRNRWCHYKNSALRATSHRGTYKSQIFFGSWVTQFSRELSHQRTNSYIPSLQGSHKQK